MPHLFLDERMDPPIWRYQIWDHKGKRHTGTGTGDKAETMKMARRRQAAEREIRDGIRPAPKPSDRPREFDAVVKEYTAWGAYQGGRHGHPWAKGHVRMKRSRLKWWKERLNLSLMSDLKDCLPRVERALREHLRKDAAGRTCRNYAEALHSLIRWAKDRRYIEADPLEGLAPFDCTPKFTRHALTATEVQKLLAHCAPHRRLVYEVALATGLRAGELRSLESKHLDDRHSRFILDQRWTKNRRDGYQPVPRWLMDKLVKTADTGEAMRFYGTISNQWKRKHKIPDNPLLYVPHHTARELQKDLTAAGVTWEGPGWVIDFHALRVTYITLIVEAGADIKTAQTLARHSTPQLTLNVYAKVRPERLVDATEKVGETLLGATPETQPKVTGGGNEDGPFQMPEAKSA